jgi:hypothetical protein
MLVQQGDVLLEKINSIPSNAVENPRTSGGVVLAEGKATGHAHVINDSGVKMFVDGSMIYLSVEKPSRITHEEHKAVDVPKGNYVVRKVQEYDHFKEEARNVQD